MFGRGQAPYTISAALLMSLQPILVTLSKNPKTGGFDYSVPSSTMLSEALKLVISAVLLLGEAGLRPAGRVVQDSWHRASGADGAGLGRFAAVLEQRRERWHGHGLRGVGVRRRHEGHRSSAHDNAGLRSR